MSDALVIFEHNNLHPLSGLLKPGYRHVWCAVIDERNHSWVGHDLRLSGYITTALADAEFPLAQYLRDHGKEVFAVTRRARRMVGPFIWNNCVGVTKSVCGIDSLAFTPWQLRQHIIKTASGDPACRASLFT